MSRIGTTEDTLICALGCTLQPTPPYAASASTISSIHEAVRLQRELTSRPAILCVGSGYRMLRRWGDGESRRMVELARNDYAPGLVTQEPYSYSTPGNAEAVAALLLKRPAIKTIYLVSDPMQSLRAAVTFRIILWVSGVPNVTIIRKPGKQPTAYDGDKWFIRSKALWWAWNYIIAPWATPVHVLKMICRRYPLSVPPKPTR